MKPKIVAVAALIFGLGASGQSAAVIDSKNMVYSAVNVCQGALPSFEGALRKRPLAVVNEGSGSVFVSCAVTTHTSGAVGLGEATTVKITLHNSNAIAAGVFCTLASDQDIDSTGDETFLVKSAAIGARRSITIVWGAVENIDGKPFRLPGISCELPPKFEIENVTIDFSMDVGN